MPVKWTPDNDQMLLLKILETHPSLTVNTAAVSDAWPDDREKPSARAITERLVRIRKNAGVQFTVKSAQKSATTTPRKPRAKAANGEESGGSGGKRKRGGGGKVVKQEVVADEEDTEEGGVRISTKEVESLQKDAGPLFGDVHRDNDHVGVETPENHNGWNEEEEEEEEEDEVEEEQSPSKRARVNHADFSMTESPLDEDFRLEEEDEEEVSQYEEV